MELQFEVMRREKLSRNTFTGYKKSMHGNKTVQFPTVRTQDTIGIRCANDMALSP
jgi:hypothetical protein